MNPLLGSQATQKACPLVVSLPRPRNNNMVTTGMPMPNGLMVCLAEFGLAVGGWQCLGLGLGLGWRWGVMFGGFWVGGVWVGGVWVGGVWVGGVWVGGVWVGGGGLVEFGLAVGGCVWRGRQGVVAMSILPVGVGDKLD